MRQVHCRPGRKLENIAGMYGMFSLEFAGIVCYNEKAYCGDVLRSRRTVLPGVLQARKQLESLKMPHGKKADGRRHVRLPNFWRIFEVAFLPSM